MKALSILIFIAFGIVSSIAMAAKEGPIDFSETIDSDTPLERQILILEGILSVLDLKRLEHLKAYSVVKASDPSNLAFAKGMLGHRVPKCIAMQRRLEERYRPWLETLKTIEQLNGDIAQEEDSRRQFSLKARRTFYRSQAFARSVNGSIRGHDFISATHCNRFIDVCLGMARDAVKYQQ